MDLPDDLALRIDLEDLGTVWDGIPAGDQRVSVGEADGAVWAAGGGDVADGFALAINLANDLVAVERDQVVAVLQTTRIAHEDMPTIFAFGKQSNLFGDGALRFDLQQSAGIAFPDERISVGQPLAGVDFAF